MLGVSCLRLHERIHVVKKPKIITDLEAEASTHIDRVRSLLQLPNPRFLYEVRRHLSKWTLLEEPEREELLIRCLNKAEKSPELLRLRVRIEFGRVNHWHQEILKRRPSSRTLSEIATSLRGASYRCLAGRLFVENLLQAGRNPIRRYPSLRSSQVPLSRDTMDRQGETRLVLFPPLDLLRYRRVGRHKKRRAESCIARLLLWDAVNGLRRLVETQDLAAKRYQCRYCGKSIQLGEEKHLDIAPGDKTPVVFCSDRCKQTYDNRKQAAGAYPLIDPCGSEPTFDRKRYQDRLRASHATGGEGGSA